MAKKAANALTALAFITIPSVSLAQTIPAIQTGPAVASTGPVPGAPQAVSRNDPNDPKKVPLDFPPEASPLSHDKPLTSKQRKAVSIATRWRVKSAIPSMGEDGRVHFHYGAGEPTIVCAPLHVCDLALQSGEGVTRESVYVGDPRWFVKPMLAGSVTHLILKPSDAGLTTNMTVNTTTGRTYSIQLVSRLNDYMPMVAFDYPDDTGSAWQNYAQQVAAMTASAQGSPCDQAPSIPPSAFKAGDKDKRYSWKPVQVFAVATPGGQKTCVDFPSDIGSGNLPALLALADDGGWFSDPTTQMVRARFRPDRHRYEVDGVLDHFALVQGVGSGAQRITYSRMEVK